MVNVLIKKIDKFFFHTVNLWIVELTLSSALQTGIVSFRQITYTLCYKSGSVCNTNCNYLTASVCSERTLILVSLKYQTGSIHDCKYMIGFIHWHGFPRSLKLLNLICQINRFKPMTIESKNRMIESFASYRIGALSR